MSAAVNPTHYRRSQLVTAMSSSVSLPYSLTRSVQPFSRVKSSGSQVAAVYLTCLRLNGMLSVNTYVNSVDLLPGLSAMTINLLTQPLWFYSTENWARNRIPDISARCDGLSLVDPVALSVERDLFRCGASSWDGLSPDKIDAPRRD